MTMIFLEQYQNADFHMQIITFSHFAWIFSAYNQHYKTKFSLFAYFLYIYWQKDAKY